MLCKSVKLKAAVKLNLLIIIMTYSSVNKRIIFRGLHSALITSLCTMSWELQFCIKTQKNFEKQEAFHNITEDLGIPVRAYSCPIVKRTCRETQMQVHVRGYLVQVGKQSRLSTCHMNFLSRSLKWPCGHHRQVWCSLNTKIYMDIAF